jgi:predicted transcriptional regulator
MELRIKLAIAVRKQREKLALSQQALADRIKTSQPRIAKIEKAASMLPYSIRKQPFADFSKDRFVSFRPRLVGNAMF